jgi:hypothetical protein
LSLRTDPVVGVGYRFVTHAKLTISVRTGPGYVYQRYFGDDEDYFTIIFGGDLESDLPMVRNSDGVPSNCRRFRLVEITANAFT